MTDKVKFISRGEIKRLLNDGVDLSEYAIISISDSSYEHDEMINLLDGYNYTAAMFADSDANDGISDLQAKMILEFIRKNQGKKFLCHCFAGISRSGAIAKFINEFCEYGDWYLEDYKGYNRRVYNKLMAAAGLSLAAYYEQLEKEDRNV